MTTETHKRRILGQHQIPTDTVIMAPGSAPEQQSPEQRKTVMKAVSPDKWYSIQLNRVIRTGKAQTSTHGPNDEFIVKGSQVAGIPADAIAAISEVEPPAWAGK